MNRELRDIVTMAEFKDVPLEPLYMYNVEGHRIIFVDIKQGFAS